MKNVVLCLVSVVLLVLLMEGCQKETYFDESFLYGKWKSGTVYYRYDTDGGGVTWDTSDDVTEAEGQQFTWTLEADELTHIHIMAMGGSGVPKIYTVTELTETTLKYKDDFGKSYSFSKVSN